MQTSPTPPQRPLGVPAVTRAAMAVASRPRTRVPVLAAAFLLLGLALAPHAGASVYWGNAVGPVFGLPGTTIGRANNDGTGINQNFIGGASTPSAVAVDAAHVYWLNDDDHSIGRANLDGTGVNQRFLTGTNAGTVAVDGAHIYWTDVVTGDRIGRANLDGTGVDQNFITGASLPSGVAADRAHVYWTNSDTHTIGRANLDGTGVDQSFVDVGLNRRPVGLAVDAAHLYWADIRADTIGRANIDGTGVNPDFVPTGPFPFGVAVDSAHLYWTNQFPSPDGLSGGTIGRANLDGTGVTQTFLAGLADPLGVAVDVATRSPTAVRLIYLRAHARLNGVALRWRMANDVGVIGFNVYRAHGASGEWTRLNRTLIQAENGDRGRAYSFLDRTARPEANYAYRVTALDRAGAETTLGSVSTRARPRR